MLLGLGLLVRRFCQGFNFFFAEYIFSSIEHKEEVVEQTPMDSLPDDVLIHILSFLPMKQAASTFVLSKRWRTLFAFTHNLDFDVPFVNNRNNVDKWRENRKIFRDFVCRTLGLQAGSHVKKLSITIKYIREKSINHWIRYALKHGVSELQLCISGEMSSLTKVFTSTTLVKLSLGSYFTIHNLPSDTCLPSLKVLLLDGITFIPGQLSDVLLAACPVLEDFTIYWHCKREWYENYYNPDPEYARILSSKTIKNLYYTGEPWFNCYQFDLLAKATLDFPFYDDLFLFCDDSLLEQILEKKVANFLSGIHNIKTLHLTISAVKVISACCKDELPIFNNLIDLVFSSNEKGFEELLPRLLECSPNLKTLVISGLHLYALYHFLMIQIPSQNQIEKLSIMQYQGSINELIHMSHFLLKMKHLKVVKVYVVDTMDEPKKMKLTEDLIKLPTASSEVKIQVI